jgi:hypothetical protein
MPDTTIKKVEAGSSPTGDGAEISCCGEARFDASVD